MSNDFMKGPVTPDQAPTAPGVKNSTNSGLKVVVIIIVVLFGLPFLLAIIAMIFFGANFDKFAEWADSHIESGSGNIDINRRLSILEIYQASKDETVRQHGVTRDACKALVDVTKKTNNPLNSTVCEAGELELSTYYEKGTKTYIFDGALSYIQKDPDNITSSCHLVKKIKITDDKRIEDGTTKESTVPVQEE